MNELTKLLNIAHKQTLYLPVGIAGSGKSTLRECLIRRFPTIKIVSPDEIRFELLDFKNSKKAFDPEIEPKVWEKAYNQLKVCLNSKEPIIFDATNLSYSRRKSVIDIAKSKQYLIHIHEFFINPTLAYIRTITRGREVPLDVIQSQFNAKDTIKSEEFDLYTSQYQMPLEEELIEMDARKWVWWQF